MVINLMSNAMQSMTDAPMSAFSLTDKLGANGEADVMSKARMQLLCVTMTLTS